MTNVQKTLAAALGGVAVLYTAAAIAAPTKTQAPEGNHANYASHWLLIQTFTTAPAFEVTPAAGNAEGALDLAHQQKVLDAHGLTRETMDQAPVEIKRQLIEQNNFAFVEAEATGSQLIPVPNAEVCKKAGELAVDKLTVPSKMTSATYTCLPGR